MITTGKWGLRKALMEAFGEDENFTELDGFTSDDGKHDVLWQYWPSYDYETWVCVTHNKAYKECSDSDSV